MSITFETKVWENDWELILKTSHLAEQISRQNYAFDSKVLFINNVHDRSLVEASAQNLVNKAVIDKYVYVDEYAAEALKFFRLSREKLGVGYYYSIAELVSIYLSTTDYILHFSGDSITEKNTSSHWLQASLDLLETRLDVKVCNLTWNKRYAEAKSESSSEDADFYYGYGFSDQMYLVRTMDFRAPIYDELNIASQRYPKYGGELFEKRVDAWMRNNNFIRATYKHASYLHKNFTNKNWAKKLAIYLNKSTFRSD